MLHALALENFRCHENLLLEDLSPATALIGHNGMGKTSILEAIYFLSRCKSFRTSINRDIVRWGQKGYGIRGDFLGKNFQRLKLEWTGGKRSLAMDARQDMTFNQWWGQFQTVIIKSNDHQLVQSSHQIRRQWSDGLLAAVEPGYLPWLQRAHLLLRQKSAHLREDKIDRELWNSLTIQLEHLSEKITTARLRFQEEIAQTIATFYQRLALNSENVHLEFISHFEKIRDWNHQRLLDKELQQKQPWLGPHRDEWNLILNGKDLRAFGSEGQQRTAALALRLAEMEHIHRKTNTHPTLLLDDPLGGLDQRHSDPFWAFIPQETQIFYATPSLKTLPPKHTFSIREIQHGASHPGI